MSESGMVQTGDPPVRTDSSVVRHRGAPLLNPPELVVRFDTPDGPIRLYLACQEPE